MFRETLIFALAGGCLLAQAPEGGSGITALEKLLATPVVLATRSALDPVWAPAVVSVVTREEIGLSGARSVAEVLERIPGLYGIDDGLAVNLGVRGVNGGARAYGRILKVLLDGQNASFHPDATNLLGPELVPLAAVERIEVIRGPGSALYGADAFYGVVNIITRGGDAEGSLEARAGRGAAASSADGAVFVPVGSPRGGGFISAFAGVASLSGREIPPSSPILRSLGVSDRWSTEETSRPRSVYGRGWWEVSPELRLELNGGARRLDGDAEWLDFGTLSHRNRVSLDQSFLRLSGRATLTGDLELSFGTSWSEGGPSPRERLSSGDPVSYPERRFGSRTWQGEAGLRWSAPWGGTLSGGLELSQDRERLPVVFVVDAQTGAETQISPDQGHLSFQNHGAYLQVEQPIGEAWALTVNARNDAPNRYQASTTWRTALVWVPGGVLSAKLIYGTSYKAPDPFVLYAQPLFPGDLLGNPSLRPERARTWEAEVRARLSSTWNLSCNLFQSWVTDKVQAVPYLNNEHPENLARQSGHGGEAELVGFVGAHRLMVRAAWQRTDDAWKDPFQVPFQAPSPLYPEWVLQSGWRLQTEAWGAFDLWLRYASPRRASQDDIHWNYNTPYALGGYTTLSAAWTLTVGRHRFQVFGRNLGDVRYAEPGFRGYDIPGRPLEWGVSYALSF